MHVYYSGPQVAGTILLPGLSAKTDCYRCPFDSNNNHASSSSVSECVCGPWFEPLNPLYDFFATVTCTGDAMCGCENYPTASSGSISDFDSSHAVNVICTWRIISNYKIYLYFTEFSTERSYDVVIIDNTVDIITLSGSVNLDTIYKSSTGDFTIT